MQYCYYTLNGSRFYHANRNMEEKIVKEYQVVMAGDVNAERFGKVIYFDQNHINRTREGVIETVMNMYAKEGWIVKAVTNMNEYYTLITFER